MDTGVFLLVSYALAVFMLQVSLNYGMNLESATVTHPTIRGMSLKTGAEIGSRASPRTSTAPTEALRHYNIDTRDDSDDFDFNEQSGGNAFSIFMSLWSSTRRALGECENNSEKVILKFREMRMVNCVKNSLLRQIAPMLHINGSKISAMNGVFEIERTDGINFTSDDMQRERIGRSGKYEEEEEEEAEETEEDISKEPQDYIADFDRLSKKLTIRIKLIPGLILKMGRNNEGFRVGMELDQKDFEDLQGRGGTKKKLKKLKKFLPLLLIPIAIQFIVLPMLLSVLKLMATKALLAGKLALMLMFFNAAYTAVVPQHQEHNTKVANDFYGYDGGVEYGAYVNRRMERDRSLRHDLPYRAHR